MIRDRVSLCGEWKYSVNGGIEETKIVPFSALCAGKSVCTKNFNVSGSITRNKKPLLVFEGITYKADVVLNGKKIGTMLPYCRYVFDIGKIILSGENSLSVTIFDMNVPFGPSEGWENYGGIIREVYLEFVSPSYIGDIFWKTKFNKTWDEAECSVEYQIESPEKGGSYSIEAILKNNGKKIAGTQSPVVKTAGKLKFNMNDPVLWSPSSPHLYTLEVVLRRDGAEIDRLVQNVGFKELIAKGSRFFLNGEPLFLQGVCRHDMWGHDCGHTLTDAQMLKDMQMIKQSGFNFVRLVHYPHHKCILEIADRIGLLVSEEPGLWWSDLSDKSITDPAFEVLRRTIIRDRNNVSVAFWLAFNECILNSDFIAAAARIAHKTDPTRLVSGANCMNTADTKKIFTMQGFDFYTYHPYGQTPNSVTAGISGPNEPYSIDRVMHELDDKPLVFTEWGGHYPIGNRRLMEDFLDVLITAGKSTEKGKTLAGMSFWQWNDIYETNRGLPACIDGVLIEGLVDINRNPKPDLDVFHRKFMEMSCDIQKNAAVEIYGVKKTGKYLALDIKVPRPGENEFRKILSEYETVAGLRHKTKRRLIHGPVLDEDMYNLDIMPVIIRKGPPYTVCGSDSPLVIPVDAHIETLFFIGHVGFGNLYPPGDNLSKEIALYTVLYEDVEEYTVHLRYGTEICSAFCSHGPSRIDPKASGAPRVIKITHDINWEIFCINMFEVKLPHPGKVKNVSLKVTEKETTVFLYGITVVIFDE